MDFEKKLWILNSKNALVLFPVNDPKTQRINQSKVLKMPNFLWLKRVPTVTKSYARRKLLRKVKHRDVTFRRTRQLGLK